MNTGTNGPAGRRARVGHASKVDRDAATKQTTVEFVAKQSDEQVVTGVVMVPNAVDRQGDYETPETVAGFAEQFASLYESGDADGGVMHAAWPSEWMELVHNGIAGKTFPPEAPIPDDIDTMSACIDWAESETDVDDPAAFCQSYNVEDQIEDGMWVQTWRVHDDGLWQLIEDSVIEGFSIGARDVSWRGPMEQAELPEGVSVPAEYPDDDPVWELEDGIIREVSAVDTPAVPEAMILAKDDGEKALDQYLGDREGFMAEAQQRGHSESAAEQLWDVLSRATEAEGADSPGKSLYERIGRAAAKALPGISDPEDDDTTDDAPAAEFQTRADSLKRFRAEKEWGADTFWVRAGDDPMESQEPGDLLGVAVDMPEADVYIDWRREAFPDPLEEPHVSIYGSIDDLLTATSNVIEPAGSIVSDVPDGDDDGADMAAKEGRTLSAPNRRSLFATIDASLDVLEDAGVGHGMTRFTDREDTEFSLTEHSARTWGDGGGDDDGTDDEPDDDDEDDPEDTESMTDTDTDDDTDKSGGDGGDPFDDAPAWAQSLKDSVDENSKQITNLTEDGDADKDDDPNPFEDAPEWAKALAEQVEANAAAVENIGKQAGFSQQVQGGGDEANGETEDKSLAGVLRQAGVQ